MKLQRAFIAIASAIFVAAITMGATAVPIPNGTGKATLDGMNARFLGSVPITPALGTTTIAASTSLFLPGVYNCDASGGNRSINFASGASGSGRLFVFKEIDSSGNTCTINPAGSDTIDGAGNVVLSAQYQWAVIIDAAPGTWSIISATSSGGGGGTLAGDANGAAGSNTVSTVLSGQTPISASTSMNGDLAGNLPSPTVARIHLGITTVSHGSSPYSASSADSALECDASGGAVSISLPGTATGKMIVIKKIDSSANACTISTALDGTANYKLSAQNQSLTAYYNATTTHWNTLSGTASAAVDSITGIAGGVSDSISNMSLNGTFNVKSPLYGATGSGIFGTDDAGAIQAAINAACASNNVSDAHVSASTVYFPPGSYRISYPLWVNCAGLTLAGAGMYSSVLSPTYDAGPTVIFAAGAYPGVPLAAPLVGSTGNSFDFTQDRSHHPFINLREWDGTHGPLGAPSGMNLNGLSAFTVEYFVNDVTAGDGAAVSSGSEQSISLGQAPAFYSGIGSARWLDSLQLSGSGPVALNPVGTITANTVYYRALTYDGTTCRQYACAPGSTSCAPIATASCSGTVVQGPTEEVTIGPEIQLWPDGAITQTAINGKIYGVRISNSARWPSTIPTVPNAPVATAGDANTLALTNGEQAPGAVTANTPNGPPVYIAYNNTPSGGYGKWLAFGFSYNRVQANNYFIAENAMRDLGVRGVVDNSGIIFVAGKDSNFDNLYLQQIEVGIENFNLSYEARNFSNITILGAPGRYGIDDIGGGLNTFKGTKIANMWACEVAGGDTWINPVCIQNDSFCESRYGLVLNNLGGSNPGEATVIDPVDDSENASCPQTPFYVTANGGNTVLNVVGGVPEAEDGAPIAFLDNGGVVNFQGTAITSNGGSPTQIVQAAGSTTGTAVMTSPTFIGWSGAALSSTAGVVRMMPCAGSVTLSSGAGTFSNVCVTTKSACFGLDTTTPANAVTFGALSAGSVVVNGTGTDVANVSCN